MQLIFYNSSHFSHQTFSRWDDGRQTLRKIIKLVVAEWAREIRPSWIWSHARLIQLIISTLLTFAITLIIIESWVMSYCMQLKLNICCHVSSFVSAKWNYYYKNLWCTSPHTLYNLNTIFFISADSSDQKRIKIFSHLSMRTEVSESNKSQNELCAVRKFM